MPGSHQTISVEEHSARLLCLVRQLPPATLKIGPALLGAVLASDVHAQHPLPLWDNSAMDGFAVRSADTTTASDSAPVSLEVIGEIPAGSSRDPEIAKGQCVKIMTGAPLPTTADAVVRIEDTSAADTGWEVSSVQIKLPVAAGKDIRQRGEDKSAGDLIALTGDELTAPRLSALAAAGASELTVRIAPKVAVLVTGAELRPPGQELSRGQIPETNSLLIAGLLAESGIRAATIVHCVDEPQAVREQLAKLAPIHDAILSTGGVGPGDFDVMRQVLADEPGVTATRVRVRPGQPQCAGRLAGGAMIFALPGNPVSAAASFELFVRPALRAMQGHAQVQRPRLQAVAAVGWRAAGNRLQVLPIVFQHGDLQHGSQLQCAPAVAASRISHSVGGFGSAQGYALVPAGIEEIHPGDTVEVLRIAP
ncbi:gephyrin-like molybdotransferase Glp [Glutamicibacter sp. JC586]|uniref:molybdopterin molybdotransferase MoeA n=1 Tax=Glutamicibacter sp. JC586 TaxID=2590552 RepID=UPI0013583DF8|nr:gephyrin-like molybdotransferase Glp [Glutamicibacter sp. JC586]